MVAGKTWRAAIGNNQKILHPLLYPPPCQKMGEGQACELRYEIDAHSEPSERLEEKNQRRPHPPLSQVRERDWSGASD